MAHSYNKLYPDIYKKGNDTYTYFGDDGTRFTLVAGQDGVTEEWIQFLKEEHRKEAVADHRQKKYRWNGEKYERMVISLNGLLETTRDSLTELEDPNGNPEELFIRNEEAKQLNQRIKEALSALSPDQRELLYKLRIAGIPEKRIANDEGVSCAAICSRLDRIICKILINFQKDR